MAVQRNCRRQRVAQGEWLHCRSLAHADKPLSGLNGGQSHRDYGVDVIAPANDETSMAWPGHAFLPARILRDEDRNNYVTLNSHTS